MEPRRPLFQEIKQTDLGRFLRVGVVGGREEGYRGEAAQIRSVVFGHGGLSDHTRPFGSGSTLWCYYLKSLNEKVE